MDRRLVEADRVLSEHFTTSVDIQAQRYEQAIPGSDHAPEESIMTPARSLARAKWAMVEGVLSTIPDRAVLRLVYAHGTDTFAADAGRPEGLVQGRNNTQDRLGLLRCALTPSWGHGSLLRLAVGSDRARRAFEKRHPAKPVSWSAVLEFLSFEAGRGQASEGLLVEIRRECERVRDTAIQSFAIALSLAGRVARQRRDEARNAAQSAAEASLRRAQAVRLRKASPACLSGLADLHATALRVVAALEGES